ncbi:MAG: hypothetical protein AAF399_17745, partial [Bacteroidota bacterium]
EPPEIQAFFDFHLGNGFPLPTLGPVSVSDSQLVYSYQSPVQPRWATFHFSNDTLSSNKERIWQKVSGKIEAGKVMFPKPDAPFRYGFAFLMDHRGLATSSELMLSLP